MRRRHFLSLAGSAGLVPGRAIAQGAGRGLPRVCLLTFDPVSTGPSRYTPFFDRMKALGYEQGRTITLDWLSADGKAERFRDIAAECVRRQADVIVTATTPATEEAKRATSTIPIVMLALADPIGTGLVTNLAHPGGNVTGTSIFQAEIVAKQVELLRALDLAIARIGFMLVRGSPTVDLIRGTARQAASALGLDLTTAEITNADEFEPVMAAWRQAGVQAGMVVDSPQFSTGSNADRLAAAALAAKLPLIGNMVNCRKGALLGYGVDIPQVYVNAATFIDRILRGARPGDLPIEQPTRFPFVINLKTAAMLGVTVPPLLLARADWDQVKHKGLAYFILDMKQPGVQVHPLKQMNGYASFNQVFFSDALVEPEMMLCDVGDGWKVATTTLMHERRNADGTRNWAQASVRKGRIYEEEKAEVATTMEPYKWYPQRAGRVDLILPRAKETGRIKDPVVRQEIAKLLIMSKSAEWTAKRARAAQEQGKPQGPEGSLGKLVSSHVARQSARVHTYMSGQDALLSGADGPMNGLIGEILISVPAGSIAGGTDEIQRNIISERVLQMPKEPSVDTNKPFKDVPRNVVAKA